jgi:hypothetical protein
MFQCSLPLIRQIESASIKMKIEKKIRLDKTKNSQPFKLKVRDAKNRLGASKCIFEILTMLDLG